MNPLAFLPLPRWFPSGAFGLLLGVGVGACRTPAPAPAPEPELLAPEGLSIEEHTFAGTLLGGPSASAWNKQQARGWNIEAALLGHFPSEGFAPLAAHWKLIAQPGAKQPVRGASNLWMGAQFVQGEGAVGAWDRAVQGGFGPFRKLSESRGVLLEGTALVLRWSAQEIVPDPENFLRERPVRGVLDKSVALGLEFDGQTVQLGFALKNLARDSLGDNFTDSDRPEQSLQLEWALPDVTPGAEGSPMLVLLPCPFDLVPAKAVLLRIETGSADANAIERSAQALLETPVTEPEPESEASARARPLLQAIEALTDPAGDPTQRGPWLFLASSDGGPLTRDLVLTADPALLGRWAALLPTVPPESQITAEQIGWFTERAAWVCLARETVKENVEDAIVALLLRHAGEVGRYPSTLEDAALQAADGATMHLRLIQENRLFLEDSSPAARVRAFDWLQRHGESIPGFDPLESKEQRRAALQAVERAAEEEAGRSW